MKKLGRILMHSNPSLFYPPNPNVGKHMYLSSLLSHVSQLSHKLNYMGRILILVYPFDITLTSSYPFCEKCIESGWGWDVGFLRENIMNATVNQVIALPAPTNVNHMIF